MSMEIADSNPKPRSSFLHYLLYPTKTCVLSPGLPHLILFLQKVSKYRLGWNPGFKVELAQQKPMGLEPRCTGSERGYEAGDMC